MEARAKWPAQKCTTLQQMSHKEGDPRARAHVLATRVATGPHSCHAHPWVPQKGSWRATNAPSRVSHCLQEFSWQLSPAHTIQDGGTCGGLQVAQTSGEGDLAAGQPRAVVEPDPSGRLSPVSHGSRGTPFAVNLDTQKRKTRLRSNTYSVLDGDISFAKACMLQRPRDDSLLRLYTVGRDGVGVVCVPQDVPWSHLWEPSQRFFAFRSGKK